MKSAYFFLNAYFHGIFEDPSYITNLMQFFLNCYNTFWKQRLFSKTEFLFVWENTQTQVCFIHSPSQPCSFDGRQTLPRVGNVCMSVLPKYFGLETTTYLTHFFVSFLSSVHVHPLALWNHVNNSVSLVQIYVRICKFIFMWTRHIWFRNLCLPPMIFLTYCL